MKNFKKLLLVFSVVLSIILVGCGQSSTNETTDNTQATQDEVRKVVDREGNEVVLPTKTDKIISLAPSITETLVDLGLADKLVAVDKYSLEVEGVNKDLPVFDIMNPDAENIVALKPDIIFGTGMSKSNGTDPFEPMKQLGTFVTVIPTSTSVEGIEEDILYIGEVTQTKEKAMKIVEDYEKAINDILAKIEKPETPLTVYFETSPMPKPYTFGQDTFLNDMLNILGAQNIFGDQTGWLPVSPEQVVAKNPDVIFTNADFLENPIQDIKDRDGWADINAVQNNRVYLIEKNTSSRANEKSIVAFESMAKALYPESFN